jgi:hypothetical protein
MSNSFIVALLVGAGLYFPTQYALQLTMAAFKTSPMEKVVGVYKRTYALWILILATAYVLIVGTAFMSRLPHGASMVLKPVFWVVAGLGPLVWWYISRQAHAQFDRETTVPANTAGWALRRAIRQYINAWPDVNVEVAILETGSSGREEHSVVITWTPPNHEQHQQRFWFLTSDKTARFWASLYAISPDTTQFDTLTFTRTDGRSRGQLS